MWHLTTKLLVAAVVAAIGAAGFAGMAVAHSATTSSQHTIDFTSDVASDRFTGQVSSKKAACERGRSIVLYRVVGDTSVPDQKVTKAKTDSGGVWSKGLGDTQAGKYYAVAAKKVIRSHAHKHTCKRAKSALLSVSPVLAGLSLEPDKVAVGQELTGTVSLSMPAEEDLVVSLVSSDAAVASVPASVTVSAGQAQASFPITASASGSTKITASLNGASFEQTLHIFTVLNETGVAAEADSCHIQFPSSTAASSGQETELIYGHLFESQATESPGPSPNVVAEVGFGPAGSDPRTASGWRFTTADFNAQVGNEDEYSATLSAPSVSSQTSYSYAYRFSLDDGGGFTYCDTDGAGSASGLDFDSGALGTLTVNP